MTTHRDLLQTVIEQEAAALPAGCDTWAIKSVRPDLRTRDGFRWAYPGGTSRSDHNADRNNTDACPDRGGDGLCVAFTWEGMASGGIPARTLLLVAYPSANVLGYDEQKARLAGEVHVVALVDGERLIREHGRHANLQGAYLRCADLRDADLQGADLRSANLWRVDLRDADLRSANLWRADLQGADLQGADLWRADLRRVDLRDADLRAAHLRYADLQGADLQGADLWRADLRRVDLRDADLRAAHLRYADLQGADLQGADLRRVDLRYADLRAAHLRYADLQGADLQGADLRRADLQGADLQGADLRYAEMYTLPAGWGVGEDGRAVRTS